MLIYNHFKIGRIEEKVWNTNKFLFETILPDRIKALNNHSSAEVIAGRGDAPHSVVLYVKDNCTYCEMFFRKEYADLYANVLDKQNINLVIRTLDSINNEEKLGLFLDNLVVETDSLIKPNLARKDFEKLRFDFKSNLIKAHKAGINATPSFIIGNQLYKGFRTAKQLEELINQNLYSNDQTNY